MAVTIVEEPMLSRLDRLDNLVRHLEELKVGNSYRTPKSSCPSTPSSKSDGQASSFDFSPRSIEKHCRPIDDVIVETEAKGTLIERIVHVEDRVAKLEEEMEAQKRRLEEEEKKKMNKKKGLKQLSLLREYV
ncbi:hypothetical protein M8C21_003246 [Ambrosia artemisiifolia]|uniref:Uncharacterized protein n=1 Tax=Ambrosia artemisiifolia TaxID=4212 RepID=A0AAD5CGU3_AMBAR|nr:hypothetical protein M8C21_003246 [Ambrosia artemisiifolia]